MGERIRLFDWSGTALGPIEQWPQSLKTALSTSLGCAFPIILWWGPELTVLYNDEYRPMFGAKHPGALGQPGACAWAAIWDVIGPMLSQVMERGEATRSRDLLLHIDRHGYPEEAYFSFSYSPIRVENGHIGGVFCPVIETTEKVIGERRLRTLRDLAAAFQGVETEQAIFQSAASVLAANAYDVPFAVLYRIDESGQVAELESTAGIAAGSPAASSRVPLPPDGRRATRRLVAGYRGRNGQALDRDRPCLAFRRPADWRLEEPGSFRHRPSNPAARTSPPLRGAGRGRQPPAAAR